MNSTDYKLAAALVAAIQAALPAYSVSLVGDPRADRKSITELQILVRPASFAQQIDSRESELDEREMHVGVVGPCTAASTEALDGYLKVCDDVRALWGPDGELRDTRIESHEWAGEVRQNPLWDDELLLASNLFAATITVKYQANN